MDKVKIVLLLPLLIGGSIVVMMFSYLLVPMSIVALAIFFSVIINRGLKEDKKIRNKKRAKKLRKKYKKRFASED
jgi:uncharacterized membrane protein